MPFAHLEHAVTAATHPDPYPFYTRLRSCPPLGRDDGLGMRLAADAATVAAVLTDHRCRVRPPAEPVPTVLAGSVAGGVFRRLVRMIDGEAHASGRRAVVAALATLDPASVGAVGRRRATVLLAERGAGGAGWLTRFALDLPAFVVGGLLGIAEGALPATARAVEAFARCLAPGSTSEEIALGKVAAERLAGEVRAILDRGEPGGLLAALLAARLTAGGRCPTRDPESVPHRTSVHDPDPGPEPAGPPAPDPEWVVANAIGLLVQAHEATAGLVLNGLRALALDPALRAAVAADPGLLGPLLAEVLRFDPPVQNTRRFVAEAGEMAGQPVSPGDTILVLLAAAGRDPAANPDPNRFDLHRGERRLFAFGAGSHECPGQGVALAVAEAAVRAVLESGVGLERLAEPRSFRRSANTRLPVWP
jgi:cytochrome P450